MVTLNKPLNQVHALIAVSFVDRALTAHYQEMELLREYPAGVTGTLNGNNNQ
jgi:hypothetical protein